MKKYIAEDLPARSHPQAQLSPQSNKPESNRSGEDRGDKTPEKRISQAASDIRYRARRENVPLRTAYSQYMQNSSMSEMEKSEVRKKIFGKESGMQSEHVDMKSAASDSMMKALYKVFVDNQPEITEEYIEELKKDFFKKETSRVGAGAGERKYKVRVHDKQSGISYVRYATRDKISQLRARGLDVEMTEYGEPYEGEKQKGEQTAEVSKSRSMAQKDFDGDGKRESGSKEHAGVVHNAIQRKKGLPADGKDTSNVKENFIREVLGMANLPQMDAPANVGPSENQNQLDVLPPNKKNKVTVNPTNAVMDHAKLNGNLINENGYKKFLGLLQEMEMTAANKAKEAELKQKYDASSMKKTMQDDYGKETGKKVYFASIRKQAMKEGSDCGCDETTEEKSKKGPGCVDDSRSIPTSIKLAKTKLQSMGIKNPIMMSASYEPEGEIVDEARAEERRGHGSTGALRNRQKSGESGPKGSRPVTSFSGGQNPHLRGKESTTKTQRREGSRRYLDQPTGQHTSEEQPNKYLSKQANKRKRPQIGSRFD